MNQTLRTWGVILDFLGFALMLVGVGIWSYPEKRVNWKLAGRIIPIFLLAGGICVVAGLTLTFLSF